MDSSKLYNEYGVLREDLTKIIHNYAVAMREELASVLGREDAVDPVMWTILGNEVVQQVNAEFILIKIKAAAQKRRSAITRCT